MMYVSPSGRVIDLVAPGDWVRALAYGGVVGMVGTKTATTSQAVSVPGQTPTSFQTKEMKGQLTFLVMDSPGRASVDELVSEINREFSPDVYGTLILDRPGSVGRLSTPVRLDGPIDFPSSFLGAGDPDVEVKVPLVSDEGLWSQSSTSVTGTVTVTNIGDEFLWPSVQWTANSTLELPSTAVVSLPVPGDGQPRVMSLDPYTSHEVARLDGTVDAELSMLMAPMLLAEGVPQHQSRTYRTTGGAVVQWACQFLNPWR